MGADPAHRQRSGRTLTTVFGRAAAPRARHEDLRAALAEYRSRFGWSVRVRDRSLELLLGNGIAAVTVPAGWAGEVAHRLRTQDCAGPVLALPGPARRWAFLASLDDPAPPPAPYGVTILLAPQRLPLPPTVTAQGRVRWVVPPDPRDRWLPAFAAVRYAVRAARPPAEW